uniref:Transposase, mutator type n=1 Tax=Tanacetum cinerariifolium TaxID=118510 RepID=A0A699IHL8_TANCI|nr:transposase, mutator type [Tanacetum cinerariifolium]
MEMKANTTLVKMAAKTDLKETYDEFVCARNRLVKAQRCVEVLELVEKNLNNNLLESKAEKDSTWVYYIGHRFLSGWRIGNVSVITLVLLLGGWFTPTPSRSYICGQKTYVLSFFIPSLGLDYGLHSLNVDADVLEMANTNVVECAEDPFEELNDILGEYAHIRKQITRNEITRNEITRNESTGNEITRKQMVVHVGNRSTVDDVLELEMLFEIEGVGPARKFKEVEVDADNELEKKSDTKGDYTIDSDSEDLDYDLKHDDVFDDDEHIVEEVHVNMNNFIFTADPKHDTSIGGVDIQDDDLDVIDYDSFRNDLDDGIDSEMRMQLRELRRIGKQKNKGPKKYYFYLGQQFASKEIVKGRVKKHSIETRRQLILVKNNNEKVRVRCHGTIPTLVPYVATNNNTDKNVFSQTKGGPSIRENINSGKQNILGKDKKVEGKGKKVNTPNKVDKNSCPWTMLVTYTKECRWEFKIKCRDNLRVYMCLGALKQGFRACGREILGLDGCFMSGPWPGQILTAVEVDANNGIYPVSYVIAEAESKASWYSFNPILNLNCPQGLIQAIASVFPYAKHREYLMKRIVVVQKVIAKTVGPLTPSVTKMFDVIKKATEKWELTGIPCKHDVAAIYNMSENSVGVCIPEQWVHAAYRLKTWAYVYSFMVNPCHKRRGKIQMMRLQVKVLHQASFLERESRSVMVNMAMWVITGKAAGVKVVVLDKLMQGRSLVKLLVQQMYLAKLLVQERSLVKLLVQQIYLVKLLVQERSLVKLLVQERSLVKLLIQGRPQVNLVQHKAQQNKDQGKVFRDQ